MSDYIDEVRDNKNSKIIPWNFILKNSKHSTAMELSVSLCRRSVFRGSRPIRGHKEMVSLSPGGGLCKASIFPGAWSEVTDTATLIIQPSSPWGPISWSVSDLTQSIEYINLDIMLRCFLFCGIHKVCFSWT